MSKDVEDREDAQGRDAKSMRQRRTDDRARRKTPGPWFSPHLEGDGHILLGRPALALGFAAAAAGARTPSYRNAGIVLFGCGAMTIAAASFFLTF